MSGPSPDDDLPRRRLGPALLSAALAAALLALAAAGAQGAFRDGRRVLAAAQGGAAAPASAALAIPPPQRFAVSTRRLARHQTVAQALFALRLGGDEVRAVLLALGDLFPFRRARPGDQIRLERRQDGALHRLSYRQGPADEWTVRREADGALRAGKREVDLRTEVARVAVGVRSSLYETLLVAGEDPALAVEVADVLAWDVDFYQDVRDGDSLKALVEKVYADGRFLRYGQVLAAEYAGPAVGVKRLFRYLDPSGQAAYFDEDGQSARRGLLKAPLRYAHVTSRYGNRRHPILRFTRAHQGVDYGAPRGTPVWAVGDGTVSQAGWSGGCGRSVTLRHPGGYETVYCHLSRVSVAPGARVSQKQVIGQVGQSGLATGPHLHYAVKRGGAFVNPLKLAVPRGAPVPPAWRPDFFRKIGPLRARLEEIPLAMR